MRAIGDDHEELLNVVCRDGVHCRFTEARLEIAEQVRIASRVFSRAWVFWCVLKSSIPSRTVIATSLEFGASRIISVQKNTCTGTQSYY